MYSTPQWALPFAAHCRSRLAMSEALSAPVSGIARAGHRWHAAPAPRTYAGWHAACWSLRRRRGNS